VRAAGFLGALCLVPVCVGAAPIRLVVEPLSFGVERLDRLYDAGGLESRVAARIGAGLGCDLGHGLQAGLAAGTASGMTTFGLLADPTARVVRTDVGLELRGRVPRDLHGWKLQGALGLGRLRLAYHPDGIVLDTSSGMIPVDLPPVDAWTRLAAAEVLHSCGRAEIAMRCAWRFYALDVAGPAGTRATDAVDMQAGLVIRVSSF
jgi:hypothetical protein